MVTHNDGAWEQTEWRRKTNDYELVVRKEDMGFAWACFYEGNQVEFGIKRSVLMAYIEAEQALERHAASQSKDK